MVCAIITDEIKKRAVIVSMKAKHSSLEIVRFLKLSKSFFCNVINELPENNADELVMVKIEQQ